MTRSGRTGSPMVWALLLALAASVAAAQQPEGGRKKKKKQIAELTAKVAESEQRLAQQQRQIEELARQLAETRKKLAAAQEQTRAARARQTELERRLSERAEPVEVRAPLGQAETAASGQPPVHRKRIGGGARPCLRLRAGPDLEAERLDCLAPGTQITVLEETDAWTRVETSDGTQGWLAADYLEDAPESPPQGSVSDLRRQLEELQASREEAERRLASLTTDLDAARQEAADWRRQAEDRQTASEELGARLAEAERWQAESEQLQTRLAEAEARLAELATAPPPGAAEPPREGPAPEPMSVRRPLAIAEEEVPAPEAETVPAPAARPTIEDAPARVEAWAAAWSDQRVDDYLSFYAAGFQPPPNLSRREWEALRKQRLDRPAYIRISLAEMRLLPDGPDRARVTFRQSYESDVFSDTVVKVLTLVVEDGAWKILAEQVTD